VTGLSPKRADELESLFGDPAEPGNPVGFAAILEADERAEMLTAGEDLLAEFGLNAEFVPPESGGRLSRVDHLVEVMRSVYRRDPALGLGYGASSFISGVNVWTAGSAGQTAHVAGMLLDGRRVAVAFHELAHGNDMAGTELSAMADGDGWLLAGRKEVVTNIRRADAMVVFARTDPRPGPRSHSLMLVDRATTPGARMRDLPRFTSVGMRGVQLGGMEFDDVPVPASGVLGAAGTGLETALKALQITRTALPAMASGALDTGLRTVVDHLSTRRLYGGAAIDLPHVRSVLVGVFADLLKAEVFSAVGARALHLVPGSASVYSSAVKFAVSKLLIDAMDRLSVLLGAHFYLREGPRAIFQKLLRDLAPVGFGHIARAACQSSLLPQLPLLAKRSWTVGGPAPAGLFDLGADLPPLAYNRLALYAAGRDPLAASLTELLDTPWDHGHKDLRSAAEATRSELACLAVACAGLPMTELGVDASPACYDLVTRYVDVLARVSCLQVWRHTGDPFLSGPAWLRAVLCGSGKPLPEDLENTLYTELIERHRGHLSFGVTARRLG
jgi:alkylation response protein AidB-like acyl-CoA dehydrogenase